MSDGCRTDDCGPTYLTQHARATTEHEVASPSAPREPTDPTEQAHLQGEPAQAAAAPNPLRAHYELCVDPDCPLAYAYGDDDHWHFIGSAIHPAWDVP